MLPFTTAFAFTRRQVRLSFRSRKTGVLGPRSVREISAIGFDGCRPRRRWGCARCGAYHWGVICHSLGRGLRARAAFLLISSHWRFGFHGWCFAIRDVVSLCGFHWHERLQARARCSPPNPDAKIVPFMVAVHGGAGKPLARTPDRQLRAYVDSPLESYAGSPCGPVYHAPRNRLHDIALVVPRHFDQDHHRCSLLPHHLAHADFYRQKGQIS